jgi:hypothetical protein
MVIINIVVVIEIIQVVIIIVTANWNNPHLNYDHNCYGPFSFYI